DGRVLVAGGENYAYEPNPGVAFAEVYDPATGAWTSTGNMNYGRSLFQSTLLPNGQVLVEGGASFTAFRNTAELWNPATNVWTLTGSMHDARANFSATLIEGSGTALDGQVLVAGGVNTVTSGGAATGAMASTEIY